MTIEDKCAQTTIGQILGGLALELKERCYLNI